MTLSTQRRRDRRKARHAQVYLDGVNVSRRCYYADGRRGVVRLFVLNALREERRGHVRILLGRV